MSITLRQAQHEVADDVPLNFGRARFDRIAASAQISVSPLTVVDRVPAASGELPISSKHLHRHLLHSLVHLDPEYFLNRDFRDGDAALAYPRTRAILIEAEFFYIGGSLCED